MNLLSLPEQVRRHIEPEPMSGCWLWGGCQSKNKYGGITYNGTRRHSHRLVYQLLKGDVPDGLDLDHLCRVRQCVNPDHLEPVTRAENLRRSPLMLGHPRAFCRRGHPRSGDNIIEVRRSSGKIDRNCKVCTGIRELRAKEKKASLTHA